MAMSPGMKMMMIQRTAQDRNRNQSEYGGGRRMIGYDRSMNGQANSYATESRMRDEGGRYATGDMGWDSPPRSEYDEGRYATESRRRRDSRGRYMMDDDDDEFKRHHPGMPTGFPKMQSGGSYGDIYADIYAPNAMNRPQQPEHHSGHEEPVDEQTARKWVKKMDGGEHFRTEQADQLRAGICPECSRWEFYVALNAMYSDHCETAKRMNLDKPEFYAHLAKDFLMDEDAKPHKLRRYMENIAK